MVSMSMTKKDARKCSHCGHNGHNSRTCNNFKEVKLFGVRIDDNNNNNNNNHHQGGDNKMKMKIGDEFIRRSKSLGNLESAASNDLYHGIDAGYFSDGPRKKGKPWTEEEHRSFLIGLDKLGKGDWRGISKNYVLSRTSTQVASHAQKYFNRISTSNEKRKRRPSVFDVHLNDPNLQISSKASTSLPSIPNNIPEVQKEASAPLEQLFETCKIKGQPTKTYKYLQAAKTTPSATCEKPPLSPMSTRRFVVPDFRHIPSMMGSLSRNVDGLTASTKVTPTVSWYPVFNFPNPYQYAHILNPEGATFTPYVARPSSTGILSRQPPQVQSQAAIHSPPVTNKDGLNISIGALGV